MLPTHRLLQTQHELPPLPYRADGELAVHNSDDADSPLRLNEVPLLACDVWEHAYCIDYRNERTKYIEAFRHLVNWDFVACNLAGE